jgi:hypothetical protein
VFQAELMTKSIHGNALPISAEFFRKLAFLSSLITDFLFAMFRFAKHLHAQAYHPWCSHSERMMRFAFL